MGISFGLPRLSKIEVKIPVMLVIFWLVMSVAGQAGLPALSEKKLAGLLAMAAIEAHGLKATMLPSPEVGVGHEPPPVVTV